jgi:F-type H+-transporting ATPase subunit b
LSGRRAKAAQPQHGECATMNALVLLAEAGSGGQIEQIARTFGVDWPHLLAQMISFGIVCLLLYRFAYRPILKMLEERRQLIAQGLANTEKIKAELARTEAQRQEVMVQANAQATQFIEEARAVAARLQKEETQKAIAAAEQIIVKACEAAAQDQARMLADLKREVGRLVIQTTAAVTGKILTPEDQRRLAEETARQVTA